jgi:hypothetical protein
MSRFRLNQVWVFGRTSSVLSQKFAAIVGELSARLARRADEGVALLYFEEA